MNDWIEAKIETTAEGIDNVCAMLYGCAIGGLMLDDADEFKLFAENPEGDWDYIGEELLQEKLALPYGVTFYVTENASGIETLNAVKDGLRRLKNDDSADYGSLELTLKNVKEEDWANNWKKYFKPFNVGEKILIRPSWEKLAETPKDRVVLSIDPGHIFGTGTHETTRLCLELIEKAVRKDDFVLDIGCGSGILSIAATLLGASKAEAVDIDPNATPIVMQNAQTNGITEERLAVTSGNILESEELDKLYSSKKHNVVMANIVADVIIALCPKVRDYITDDGFFISSGIIKERANDVKTALKANGFTLLEEKTEGEWVALLSKYEGGQNA